MRHKIVAGNWKMNNNLEEGLKLTSEIVNMVNDEVMENIKIILATPFIHLNSVAKLIEAQEKVFLAGQNCSEHKSGAFTGEISANMLASTGASHVILGHSERREYFNESNEQLAKKVDIVLAHNLIPIFCCGESLEIRENGNHFEFVKQQLTESIFHLDGHQLNKLIIAYEPIWAIGTGKTATVQQAQDMHQVIRQHIRDKYKDTIADEMSILYGGSCKPSNAKELFACEDVDGGLIGGASLKSRDFIDIIKSFN